MMNSDTRAAWIYHDGTKHSVASLRAHRHYLDWEIKPRPFKVYPNVEPIPLPRELPHSTVAALVAVAAGEVPVTDAPRIPDLPSLARVLHFSAGITRKKVYPGGEEYHFRAAACTGALYHIDLYVISGDLPGLAAGVYHFGPHNFALHQLRGGDHRGVLVEATGAEPSIEHARVIIAFASTYWRNSWKYQSRAYRHCFWDSGTMLANLLAVAAAGGMPARMVVGFVDGSVGALLGLDAAREGPLALLALGHDSGAATPPQPPVASLGLETLPLSSREVDYPAIREMQAASALQTPEEVRTWRAGAVEAGEQPGVPGHAIPLSPFDPVALPAESVDRVIQRRGSARRFEPRPISLEQLSAILWCATRGVATDFGASLNDLYLIVNAVEGLPSGAYVYRRADHRLEILQAGVFRREAGHLALGQDLAADASVNMYLLAKLDPVLERFGNRGYRVAQLDAAITGGKLYLAAYALDLAATGLTFFDDDVTRFFGPHAAGKSVMFLVAVGHGTKALAQLRRTASTAPRG
jgi:SagB-type dehydrogenase family enzyme